MFFDWSPLHHYCDTWSENKKKKMKKQWTSLAVVGYEQQTRRERHNKGVQSQVLEKPTTTKTKDQILMSKKKKNETAPCFIQKGTNNVTFKGNACVCVCVYCGWSFHGSWFPQNGCVCNHGSNHIWVHVRCRPPILKITLPCFLCVPPNSNRSTTICNSLHSSITQNHESWSQTNEKNQCQMKHV